MTRERTSTSLAVNGLIREFKLEESNLVVRIVFMAKSSRSGESLWD